MSPGYPVAKSRPQKLVSFQATFVLQMTSPIGDNTVNFRLRVYCDACLIFNSDQFDVFQFPNYEYLRMLVLK